MEIKIKIDGKEYTIEEAKKIKEDLDRLFRVEKEVSVLPYVVPQTAPQPTLPFYSPPPVTCENDFAWWY